jgi:predicted secreted protein
MFKFTKYLIMLTAVNLLLAACAGSVPTTEAKTVVITPAIKGNSASLNVGDTLEIQIPTIPMEGFEWVAQDLEKNILVQEGSAVYTEDPSPNAAGGIATLVFKAAGAGKTNLSLRYVNSASSLSSKSFGMTVDVK